MNLKPWKKASHNKIPPESASITANGTTLSSDFQNRSDGHAELYYDEGAIAIKPVAERTPDAYVVRRGVISNRSMIKFLNVKYGIYPAKWAEDVEAIVIKFEQAEVV